MIPVSYKVRGDHQTSIPYKVWGNIRVIDSYKVLAVDSNNIVHVEGVVCPCPQGLGA